MASRGIVSRGSTRGSPFPTSSHGRSASSICCNRCGKTLSTTVFVCACDCIFCEECTYDHFNSSSSCPNCGKNLGANDFMELVVADPSPATQETLKNSFQTLFTKLSPGSNSLSHSEMCSRLLKSMDEDRRAVRFLLKQFVFDAKHQGQRSGSLGRAYEQLKSEYTQLKQASSSQQIQLDQTIADLKLRVQSLTGTVQEQQKKLDEKENQIAQFRQLYAAEGMARIPSSSHSHSSGGKRGASGLQPPMQGFVMQKQAREHAQQKALEAMTRSRAPLRHGPSGNDSVVTPIVPPPHHRPHSNGSSSRSPGTPRIRDLSGHSGYLFTSRSRPVDDSSKRRRMGDISPSQAFAYNHPSPSYRGFGRR